MHLGPLARALEVAPRKKGLRGARRSSRRSCGLRSGWA
jgi:hypothetical protein